MKTKLQQLKQMTDAGIRRMIFDAGSVTGAARMFGIDPVLFQREVTQRKIRVRDCLNNDFGRYHVI